MSTTPCRNFSEIRTDSFKGYRFVSGDGNKLFLFNLEEKGPFVLTGRVRPMALIVGLLLIILGAVALYAWLPFVIVFLKGLLVFSLLFWGLLSLIIGYAGFKAKRQLHAALHDKPSPDEMDAAPST